MLLGLDPPDRSGVTPSSYSLGKDGTMTTDRPSAPLIRSAAILSLLVLWLLGSSSVVTAQTPYPSSFSDRVPGAAPVGEALGWLDSNFDAQVAEWIHITQIPAKSGQEAARAEYLRAQLAAEGIEVSIDDAGNMVARLPGTGGGATVVFAAHMDTVHPMDTDVTVKRDGGILRAPGIFDNSASVANMMAAIRALKRTGVQTKGDLIFLGTVEEELGFNGMDAWLDANPGVAVGRARTVAAQYACRRIWKPP